MGHWLLHASLHSWLSQSPSRPLQHLCRICSRPAGPSIASLARFHSAKARSQHYGLPKNTQLQCIKPGQLPEEVVKRIDKDDVTVTFARSGGAGGQNVNKVNTKVDMRLNVEAASWLGDDVRDALQRLEKGRINKEGELIVTSTRSRSQSDNIEDAMEKMQRALDRAAESVIPNEVDPQKVKKIAKQKRVANETRLQSKKAKSQKKTDRRAKISFD